MDLPALYAECAASVHSVTMDRIVRIESGGDPLAINVNRLAGPQPRAGSPADAARIARHYIERGHSVDTGVAQVNSRNLAALGYTVEEMFASPCKNLAAGAAILLIVYPAWDALANFVDLARSGGAATNRTQAVNVAISAATTLAVFAALNAGMHAVLTVFGIWAILSGLLQLGTALRRWKQVGAQWAMVLSGAQSALAGVLFIAQSHASMPPAIVKIAGYAAVGAAYFLISALWLQLRRARRSAS